MACWGKPGCPFRECATAVSLPKNPVGRPGPVHRPDEEIVQVGTAASDLPAMVAAIGCWNSDTLQTSMSSSAYHESGQSPTCRRLPDPVTDDVTSGIPAYRTEPLPPIVTSRLSLTQMVAIPLPPI